MTIAAIFFFIIILVSFYFIIIAIKEEEYGGMIFSLIVFVWSVVICYFLTKGAFEENIKNKEIHLSDYNMHITIIEGVPDTTYIYKVTKNN